MNKWNTTGKRTHHRRGEDRRDRALRVHAHQRFVQRIGLPLTARRHANIVVTIEEGRATFLSRQDRHLFRYRLLIDGEDIIVCYDRRRRMVRTAWPANQPEAAR